VEEGMEGEGMEGEGIEGAAEGIREMEWFSEAAEGGTEEAVEVGGGVESGRTAGKRDVTMHEDEKTRKRKDRPGSETRTRVRTAALK